LGVTALSLMNTIQSISEQALVAVSGISVSLVSPDSGTPRTGILIHNADNGFDLWLKLESGPGTPTITATDRHFNLAPGSTLLLAVGPSVKVFGKSSSGSFVTSNATVCEIQS
jgi:hypothetical protein